MPRFSKVILMFAFVAFASGGFAHDDTGNAEHMKAMMEAINAKDYVAAKLEADAAEDPIIPQIYQWFALRAGEGEFAEYEAFLSENAEWPGLGWLQARGEAKLPGGAQPQRVIDYVENYGPQTGYGLYLELAAYKDQGEEKFASDHLAEYVDQVTISPAILENIQQLNLNGFPYSAYHLVDHLVWERELDQVSAYLPFLSAADADKIRDRLAIIRGENASPSSAGAQFDYFNRALSEERDDDAIDILLRVSNSRASLGEPRYWVDKRADLARAQLWNGNPDKAYEIAAYHYLEPDEKGYADLEFLAGFIALDFQFNRQGARQHFQNLKDAVNTPISNGRAGYWLGRSGDPTGYGYGAKWQTSFYGQLSAEKLGGLYDEALIAPIPRADYGSRDLLQLDNVRAALYFENAGERLLARRFLAHQSETLPPDDAEALARLAFDMGQVDTAVNIGKNLANRAEVITSYYPIPDYLNGNISTPAPLALGIMRQESEFYPLAESHVGARGLMQLMPATAEEMAGLMEFEYDADALKGDPDYNVALGSAYINEMLITFDGQLPLAVLSYNAGPGRGVRWREHLGPLGETPDEVVAWLEQIPFDETRNYVQRVLEATFLYSAKLNQSYEGLKPSDLLVTSYPEGVDYAAIKRERAILAEEKRRMEEEAKANLGEADAPPSSDEPSTTTADEPEPEPEAESDPAAQ